MDLFCDTALDEAHAEFVRSADRVSALELRLHSLQDREVAAASPAPEVPLRQALADAASLLGAKLALLAATGATRQRLVSLRALEAGTLGPHSAGA